MASRDQALDWFVAEHPVLMAVVEETTNTGFDAHAGQLAWAMAAFLSLQGSWSEQAAVCNRRRWPRRAA